ncbi:hypothetical protein IKG45_01890 [Candidatus Saccharibacteria bacterium]|nr:hypothetical protein [Candidatus Saccharibacteria bacterium]
MDNDPTVKNNSQADSFGFLSENIDENERKTREVGAKVLVVSGFRGKHQETVDSTFERARKRGEKLVGKNDERRADAYLERIDKGIEKYGSRYEQRLWNKTVEDLIIEEDEIPESYWKTQEQILRDNGQGRELDDWEKEELTKDIQKQQRESLGAWTNYLSHEDCPYPTWFKVYTIEGVSKMGVFDKGTKTYRKRDKNSVAPYPHFNPAVLAKVYGAIADFYGIDTDEDLNREEEKTEEESERDKELEALVKSGNFNKLYSRLLLSEKVIMKTPEKTEDVHGEWVEYGVGDEEEIAKAADGTPWCIAQPSVGRSYLTQGRYGNVYDKGGESDAKFILFHLKDEDGRLAENASASIRLDTDGQVAEISGLNDGQALEDSLVPIVEEKVKTLPGGEKFLRRFADKNKLIELDRKMQSGEEISYEEFRFIYELDRPIETLDTYNSNDPRISELRAKFGAEYAKEKGYIFPDTKIDEIEENISKYLVNDLDLNSNLLTFALKKKLEESPEELKKVFVSPDVEEKLKEKGAEHIAQMRERIKNLETIETEHYTFLVPIDKWEEGKIELPENNEGDYIAPGDLTAILKQPVNYSVEYETDGRVFDWRGEVEVYGENWVGKEVHHFPLGKELLGVNEEIKERFGYHLPESWKPIVGGLKDQLNKEGRDGSDDEEISLALRERLRLTFSGYVREGVLKYVGEVGFFWSATENDEGHAWQFEISDFVAHQNEYGVHSHGSLVRMVRNKEDKE